MESGDRLGKFRTTAVGVAIILARPYVTVCSWAKKYRVRGMRGRERYAIRHLFKFRLVAVLSDCQLFTARQIIAALDAGLPWMIQKEAESYGDYYFVRPLPGDEVDVTQIASDNFLAAAKLVTEAGIVGTFVSPSGIAEDILGRVNAFIDRRPFVSPGEGLKKALLTLQVGNRAEECQK